MVNLPKTRTEADLIAKQFEDEALHWEYPDETEEEQEQEEVVENRSSPAQISSDFY